MELASRKPDRIPRATPDGGDNMATKKTRREVYTEAHLEDASLEPFSGDVVFEIDFSDGRLIRAHYLRHAREREEEALPEVLRSDDAATVYLIADDLDDAIDQARVIVGDPKVTGSRHRLKDQHVAALVAWAEEGNREGGTTAWGKKFSDAMGVAQELFEETKGPTCVDCRRWEGEPCDDCEGYCHALKVRRLPIQSVSTASTSGGPCIHFDPLDVRALNVKPLATPVQDLLDRALEVLGKQVAERRRLCGGEGDHHELTRSSDIVAGIGTAIAALARVRDL